MFARQTASADLRASMACAEAAEHLPREYASLLPDYTLAERLSEHYSVRRADLFADRPQILRLWRLITGGTAPDGHKLDWFYLGNPAGRGTIYLLWHDPTDRAVGITCAGRRDILIGQTVVKGAVCGDLVIDPAHRGRGPARRFRNCVLEHLRDEFDLFYAFPNERLAKGIAAAGPDFERELYNLVLPLRISEYLPRYMPKRLAAIVGIPAQLVLDLILKARIPRMTHEYVVSVADDAFLDALWQSVSAGRVSIGVRDSRFLNWRLRQHPSADFSMFALVYSNGLPAGYVAYETDRDSRVVIVDVLSCGEAAFAACIKMFIRQMKKAGVRSISVRKGTEPPSRLRLLKSLGFVVSERSRGFVFARANICQDLAGEMLYLNAIDSDV